MGEDQRFVRVKPAAPFQALTFSDFSHWDCMKLKDSQEFYFRLRAVGRARTAENRKKVNTGVVSGEGWGQSQLPPIPRPNYEASA